MVMGVDDAAGTVKGRQQSGGPGVMETVTAVVIAAVAVHMGRQAAAQGQGQHLGTSANAQDGLVLL